MSVRIRPGVPDMEDDAAGMVLRPALNTGFSEMGWGSTPPSSAKFCKLHGLTTTPRTKVR